MNKVLILFLVISIQLGWSNFKEGLIQYAISMPQGNGLIELKISENASFLSLQMSQMQMNIKMDFLIKTKNPNIIYQVDKKAKTYSIMDLSSLKNLGAKQLKTQEFKVKKLGTEKILGYKTSHVMVENESQKVEMWIMKDDHLYKTMERLMAANAQAADQLEALKALKKKGMAGLPLKTITHQSGQKTVMEIKKLEKKKFSKNEFSLKGYKKTEGFGSMLNQLGSGGNIKNIQKMMENMTPEKMEQLKKMMENMKQE